MSDYNYDSPMEQEDWCDAHYQYDCPICNGMECDGEAEIENIHYDAKGNKCKLENEIKDPAESLELLETLKIMAENSSCIKQF